MILALARDHECLLTLEEGSIGGFGSHVAQLLLEEGALGGTGLKMRSMILPDAFINHDKPERMYRAARLDAQGIVAKVRDMIEPRRHALRVMSR